MTTGGFGVWPRSKVSMMIMRPPQQGQGCSGVCGSLALVLAALMASIGSIGTASSSWARAIFLARWCWRAGRSSGCGESRGSTWIRKRRMNSSIASVIIL